MQKISNRNRVYFYLLITVCAWGSLYVAGKFVLNQVPVFTVLFLRYLIAGIALTLVLRKKKREKIERQDYKYILVVGFIGYFLAIGSQMIGMQLTSASFASLINSMNPVVITIFAALILKEKLTPRKAVSIGTVVAGAYIIIGHVEGDGQVLGIAASLFSVLSWSLMSVLVRKISSKYDPLTITTYGMVIALLCTLPFSIHEVLINPGFNFTHLLNWHLILPILYMGLVCTALAHILWNKSLSMAEASTCALFYPLQPVTSVLLGWLLLGEHPAGKFFIGAGLIIAGVIFSIGTGLPKTRKG